MKDLFTPIVNGIVDALHTINPDVPIYIDSPNNVEKNVEGYFFVKFPVSVTQVSYLQDFHRARLTFDVMYFPPDVNADNTELLIEASYAMSEALRRIYPAEMTNGQYTVNDVSKRCFDQAVELTDGVVHVLGSYDVFIDIDKAKEFVRKLEIQGKSK